MTRRLPVYYGWIVVGTIATMLTAAAGARFLYGVVLKPLTEQFGWDRAALTGAVLVNMIALACFQPVIGLLADRIGPKRLLIAGAVIVGAMLLPLSYATALWQIYLIYGLIGAAGFAATSPVLTTALVSRWFVKQRGTALSIATSGSALGQLIVVPAATWLMTRTDWETTFRVLAAIMILGMAPLGFLLLRDEPDRRDTSAAARSANAAHVASAKAGVRGATLRDALRASPFWLLAWGFFVCGFTMAFANTHFMAFADDMGMQPMMAADVVAVTAIFSVAGTIGLGMLADRHDRPLVLALTYFLRGVAFILLLLLPADALMFVYAVVLGISWSATTPLTAAISGDLYGRANLGLIFGVMYVFMNAGNGLGAFLDGVIYDLAGGYRIALVINVAFGLSAALAVFVVARRGAVPIGNARAQAVLSESSPASAD